MRILGILGTKILKIKSENFQIFRNLGMRIFLKNEPGIFGIFENMSIGIFKKNEPGIFGNFDMRIFF